MARRLSGGERILAWLQATDRNESEADARQIAGAPLVSDSEVRTRSRQPRCELRNQRDTSNVMILVPLLNPKFANTLAARSCELRVCGTSCSAAPSSFRATGRNRSV